MFNFNSKPYHRPSSYSIDNLPREITFSSDDTIMQRAEKICYAMGLNQDPAVITQLAAYLFQYAEWDRKKAEQQNG